MWREACKIIGFTGFFLFWGGGKDGCLNMKILYHRYNDKPHKVCYPITEKRENCGSIFSERNKSAGGGRPGKECVMRERIICLQASPELELSCDLLKDHGFLVMHSCKSGRFRRRYGF